MSNIGTPFRPVRGKEAKILASPARDGYVYFALDTKKIFYGSETGYIPMASNSSFCYGRLTLGYVPEENEIDFVFGLEDIEGNDPDVETYLVPDIDSLILNIPDGCFYRVVGYGENEYGDKTIQTKKLTIAGSGSGGGSGPAGSGSAAIERVGSATLDCVYQEGCLIEYKFSAIDSAGDETGAGVATWYVGGVKKATSIANQGYNSFDIGPYLSNGINKIQVSISVNTGGITDTVVTKPWTVNAISLSLEWRYDGTTINFTNETFKLTWTPYGAIEKTTHIIFDDYITQEFITTASGVAQSMTFEGMSHGAHKVEMYVSAKINNVTLVTPSIINEMIFVDTSLPNPEPVIGCSLQSTQMMQYDTLAIPVVIYDVQSSNGLINASFAENDIEIERWDETDTNPHENGKLYYWNYTPKNSGAMKLSITCRGTKKVLNLDVTKLDLGSVEEVSGYEFRMKASDFAGNNALRDWNSNGITATFSENFDWVNGGIQSEVAANGQVQQYICVRNGTTMTINYDLFANDALKNGKNFKFIFKAVNCRDYDAQVLKCFENNIGIIMNAQGATIKSLQNTLNVPYCEDTYIEFEFDIWPNDTSTKLINGSPVDVGKRYLMTWLDGVPAGLSIYASNDTFTQNTPTGIVIGSDNCDVNVYLVKAYDSYINDEGHLNNFIMDAPNASEILSRFRRNDILDSRNEISYSKMVEANPGLKAHLYDMSRMTKSKEDPIENCSYAMYEDVGDIPVVQATGVKVKVQGTSSARYGVAAYNLDSDFKNGFDYADGTHSDSYAMTENSIPVDYFCTKVNVASCEGTNNALNQEWYNNYQPWICQHRKNNKKARDCMEFHPGVVFILDRNENITDAEYANRNVFADTAGYSSNPYYKLYSIGCMGNSKKNLEVFHDTTNPLECCVEVTDNQKAQQWMTKYDYQDDTMKDYYEFRYPDHDDATQTMKNAWRRFVQWMCLSDPSPYDADLHPHGYTGAALEAPVTFDTFIFSGKDGSSVLKGLAINTYKGTYTNDTYEYRMAKMLNECENYLVMDSVVFHYLFIERHTMVDNVAKNTFWSTEDGLHWSMNKNYDNDTADGNDNEGKLTLTYGIECLDVRDADSGAHFFNAHQSTWLNFIHGLYDARQKMFKDRENAGAWDADPYLAAHSEWQSKIPERVWIEDYYRKYRRPRELGLDASQFYSKMLEGGKKTHQRKQFETYQEPYCSSEYIGSLCTSNEITIRGYNNKPTDEKVVVSLYADAYIQAEYGGTATIPIRAKRGIKYDIVVPEMTTSNDATVYYYLAHMIQSIEKIYALTPKTVEMSKALRLRVVDINNAETGSTNNMLESVGFGSNPMLEYISVQNCPNINVSLELNGLKNLEEINIEGSGFTGISFANGAPIHTMKLNDKLAALEASNLTKIENFSAQGYDNLRILNISNCSIPTYDILKECMAVSEGVEGYNLRYNLNEVNWIIQEADGNLDTSKNSILALDFLATPSLATPNTGSKATSLTGDLVITDEAYNDTSASLYYNKYTITDMYPNLNLDFETDNSVMYLVEIEDAGKNVAWSRRIPAGSKIDAAFLSDGPNGKFETYSSYQDSQYDYTFKNSWIIKNIDADPNTIEETVAGSYPYTSIGINSNVRVEPVFVSKERSFTVSFYNNGVELQSGTHKYGTMVSTIIPLEIPYQDDSSLDLYKTYKFIGYAIGNNATPVTEEQMANLEVRDDMIFNARFKPVSVYENILDDKYLYYTNYTSSTGIAGYEIRLNPTYKLSGKITLPTEKNGLPIVSIAENGFHKGYLDLKHNITHIFWAEQNRNLQDIRSFAFRSPAESEASLKYFEFPDSVVRIEREAFSTQMNMALTKLPANLIYIGDSAFATCNAITLEEIGGKVQTIGIRAFASAMGRCPNLIIGDSVQTIGEGAFVSYQHAGIATPLTTVIIGSGIISIGPRAFEPQNFDNETINTIREIQINKKADEVAGAPWGATKATISWLG